MTLAVWAARYLATVSLAQAAPAKRSRGIIAAFDGPTPCGCHPRGEAGPCDPPGDGARLAVQKIAGQDITPRSFAGAATWHGPDGELQAIEVLVFPGNAGNGRGPLRLELAPEITMTNAMVATVVATTSGCGLNLSYRGAA